MNLVIFSTQYGNEKAFWNGDSPVIRLGESIISVETEGNPFPIEMFIKVEADNVTLFNVNY